MSPSHLDARVAKMKDRTTHLAHKAEHAVDMDIRAVIALTLMAADHAGRNSGESGTTNRAVSRESTGMRAAGEPGTVSRDCGR
jgi:transposase